MSFTEPTIRVAPAIALARQLEGRQPDFKIIARSIEFPVHRLSDPMQAVELRKMAQLFVAVSRAMNDCGLAIKLAEEADAGNSGLLGHLALAAPTVRAFLECLAGYAPILVTGVETGFDERNGTGKIMWRAPADFDATIKPLWLYFAASLVYRIRSASGPGWVPLSVEFEHKAPAATPIEYGLFGPRVSFDADRTCVTVDKGTLDKPMPSANEELFSIYKHHAALLMREIAAEQDLETRVRQAIIGRLNHDSATLDWIAHDIGVSPRAMQRRLERLGLSFEKLLDTTRCSIAERLLRETDRPLIQVAHDVGYGSQSTFTRAVRRWFHVSPRAYRQRCRRAAHAGSGQRELNIVISPNGK